jgi:hypothetical protein
MSNSYVTSLSDIGKDQINNYYSQINNNLQSQQMAIKALDQKNDELINKQQIQINQMKEIQEKEKLLLTRSRMLQISQDRNEYKKKIIYSLIAVIFAIFILTLVIYVLFVRKSAMIPK